MSTESKQAGVKGERSGPEAGRMQGHWLLAKLGKRILRPGGRALTAKLLEQAKPSGDDDIVELGPGVGATAEVLLRANPRSYRGVDPNPEGRDTVKNILKKHPRADYVVADARETGLEDASADLVVGEAMLTIQDDAGKNAIVAEAARLLRPGGRYAIHEMAWLPDHTDEERETARRELSRVIKVGARPLTLEGWKELLATHGLEAEWHDRAPLHLLEPRRIVSDEGLWGALRFWNNARRLPGASDRLKAMRQGFQLQGKLMGGIVILARKPGAASTR
ncbi:class I SAM-dependent methyltransferase [Arachnia propionica]|uniref:class I SAM-dependent methyltransferase n=1 Tax=Arachnia propionica TaxID=1750 RepID=UPI000F71D0B0|nr:class I SAM-dependent methyltransferase [Arachnia propionica]VEJ57276.1 Phospholipid N-methyltransferase [Arachnia propionica]